MHKRMLGSWAFADPAPSHLRIIRFEGGSDGRPRWEDGWHSRDALVEESELVDVRRYLADAGAEVVLIAPEGGEIQSFHDLERLFGEKYPVDVELEEARVEDFDRALPARRRRQPGHGADE